MKEIEFQNTKRVFLRKNQLNLHLLVEFTAGYMRRGKTFGNNCEVQITGSGDGRLNVHSMRHPVNEKNQRFLIHIIPKNIFKE